MIVRAMLLLMVALAFVPEDGLAKGATWTQRSVTVYDYSGPAWSPYVQEAVDRFNVMLPKRAPTLVYVGMSGPCDLNHGRAISICVVPQSQVGPGAWGGGSLVRRHGEIRSGSTLYADSAAPNLILACHELFHAMGWKEHGAWVAVEPCPYDGSIMRHLYKRDRKHR